MKQHITDSRISFLSAALLLSACGDGGGGGGGESSSTDSQTNVAPGKAGVLTGANTTGTWTEKCASSTVSILDVSPTSGMFTSCGTGAVVTCTIKPASLGSNTLTVTKKYVVNDCKDNTCTGTPLLTVNYGDSNVGSSGAPDSGEVFINNGAETWAFMKSGFIKDPAGKTNEIVGSAHFEAISPSYLPAAPNYPPEFLISHQIRKFKFIGYSDGKTNLGAINVLQPKKDRVTAVLTRQNQTFLSRAGGKTFEKAIQLFFKGPNLPGYGAVRISK